MHDDRKPRDRAVDDDGSGDARRGSTADQGAVKQASPIVKATGPRVRASVAKAGWEGENRSSEVDTGVPTVDEVSDETVGAVDPARMSAYRIAGRPVATGERVRRAARHVAHGDALAQQGDEYRAMGAALAAATTLLRAAVTPARSQSEHQAKFQSLHTGIARVGLNAKHGHIAILVDAALQAEMDAMIEQRRSLTYLTIDDVPREAAGLVRPTESATTADCSADDLDLYADLALRTHDRMAALDLMVRSLNDEMKLRRLGAPDVAMGAHVILEDLDLTVCATLAQTAVEAEEKERLLTGSLAFHATRSPLVAAVIRAALDIEIERWGFATSGRA